MNQQQMLRLSPNQSQPVDRLKLEIIPLKGGVAAAGTVGSVTVTGCMLCFADEE